MRSSALVLGFTLAVPLFGGDVSTDSLSRLRRGNEIFTAGKDGPPHVTQSDRAAAVEAQHPYAVILSCADSRVPPEHIFHEGIGSLFVVRVAGAVADPVTIGSVEYGVEHLHAPLVIVMGHTRCGAVKAALEPPDPAAPNLEMILSLIRPGIRRAPARGDAWTSAVYGGVQQTVEDLLTRSRVVPELCRRGEVRIIGAVYELETGRVVFSDPPKGGSSRTIAWSEAAR